MEGRRGGTSKHGGEEDGPLLYTPPGELSGGQPLRQQEVGAKPAAAAHFGRGNISTGARVTCCVDLSEEEPDKEESRPALEARLGGGCGIAQAAGERGGLSERQGDEEQRRLLSQGGKRTLACGARMGGFSSKRK